MPPQDQVCVEGWIPAFAGMTMIRDLFRHGERPDCREDKLFDQNEGRPDRSEDKLFDQNEERPDRSEDKLFDQTKIKSTHIPPGDDQPIIEFLHTFGNPVTAEQSGLRVEMAHHGACIAGGRFECLFDTGSSGNHAGKC